MADQVFNCNEGALEFLISTMTSSSGVGDQIFRPGKRRMAKSRPNTGKPGLITGKFLPRAIEPRLPEPATIANELRPSNSSTSHSTAGHHQHIIGRVRKPAVDLLDGIDEVYSATSIPSPTVQTIHTPAPTWPQKVRPPSASTFTAFEITLPQNTRRNQDL